MKKYISLSLVLSLGLATITPALNAITMKQRIAGAMPSMPAWTKGPGFQAAKKWWRAGRKMNVLNPEEQKAFNNLKTKIGIGAIITAVVALLGTAAYVTHRKQQEKQRKESQQQTGEVIGEIAEKARREKVYSGRAKAMQEYFASVERRDNPDWVKLEGLIDKILPSSEKADFNEFTKNNFGYFTDKFVKDIDGKPYFDYRLQVIRDAGKKPAGYFESKMSHLPQNRFQNKKLYQTIIQYYESDR